MNRFKYSLLAAAGILVLAAVLNMIGPKRVMAALGYTPVRDVDFAARKPLILSFNLGSGGMGPVYIIPDKKRLVIEFISISAPGSTSAGLGIWDAALTGYIDLIRFPLTNGIYAGAAKIYVEPGTAKFAPGTALKLFAEGGVSANLTLSGYLEPIP